MEHILDHFKADKNIPKAVIERLPRYYRFLGELREQFVERISSKELSEIMNVTASQIRQDLNHFGGFGQQGYGYNVDYLYNEIGSILGLNEKYNLIIIGAGNLGQALANYMNFKKRGFHVCGMFDINESLIGTKVRGIEIMPTSLIQSFMASTQVDIAVLTIPKEGAVDMANKLVSYGIKAILNFAHIDLNVPENVQVENIHLSDSLMKLSYKIHEYEADHEKRF